MNDTAVGMTEDENNLLRRKLIKALLSKNANILQGQEIPEVTPDEEERFLRMVSTGAVSAKDFENAVSGVAAPAATAIFPIIEHNNFKRRILAYMTGLGFNNFQSVNAESITKFLEKFPRPSDFASAKNDFIEAIKRGNTEEKYQEYKKEVEELEEIVYGERWRLTAVIEEAKKEAEDWQLKQDAVKLKTEFLDRAVIEGDPWIQQGLAYQLKPEYLEQVGLGPMFLIEVGGVRIAFSKSFLVDVHEAIIAYVAFDDTVKVRGYYRSNSQGMWRYLPDYINKNGEIGWYGVGFNEESLTLPLKIQKELNRIAKKYKMELKDVNPGFFLGGTARRFDSKEQYQSLITSGRMTGAYYAEVSTVPKLDFGVLSPRKHPPQSVDVRGNAEPDFRQQLNHYDMETQMYGAVTVRQFPSRDDVLRYSVCEVGKGNNKKAWVGSIEVNAPITSTGLKREWVSTGDICTPLLEYQSMAGGFGVNVGRTDGYLSMWENYLRLAPIIKDYLFVWRDY